MNDVIKYFQEYQFEPFQKLITVYGWQKQYKHLLVSGVFPYLFEELKVNENLAPKTNLNRPGVIMPKFYITIHDTGDADKEHTAHFWNETVKNMYWSEGEYYASFHYVVGNDGIYQQIPDDEVAWHAGDGTKYFYTLYDTLVDGNKVDSFRVDNEGFYEINHQKTPVKSPMFGINKCCKICDQGVLIKRIGQRFYIGETYFNETYNVIANRCGNNNSIGIETCINENTNLYYTWMLSAKLVANLMDKYEIGIEQVRQHHFFSGKNCPQTMRENNLWNHFLELIKFEYKMLCWIKEGYQIKFIPLSKGLEENGLISDITLKSYTFYLEVKYQDKTEKIKMTKSLTL